nr:MAG TPA: hypothetical protein [Caudoviricetes sp.]DAT24704.1 MAG TPA: hypothetical protein [Caudoviricetes sp.]
MVFIAKGFGLTFRINRHKKHALSGRDLIPLVVQ